MVVGVMLQYVQNGCRVVTVAEIAPVLLKELIECVATKM